MSGWIEFSPSNVVPSPPEFVYRYLPVKEAAEAMELGLVRLSTLHQIRTAQSARADPGDGTVTYLVKDAVWLDSGLKSSEAGALERRGFYFPPMSSMRHCAVREVHQNSYVLCTALASCDDARMRRVFGEYRVRIRHPGKFADLIARELSSRFGAIDRAQGLVDYSGRNKALDQLSDIPPAFVGHPGNVSECEWRMVWSPTSLSAEMEPLELNIPRLSRFCKID